MRLLVAHGADPNIPSMRPAGRPRTGDGDRDVIADISGLPPVPVGGPGVPPLVAAAGVGYGEGFAANSHRHAPTGIAAALKYMVEELGADVNAVDFEGNNAVHHSAARGDVESILYLVSQGADVTRISREGRSTADMANAPVQRVAAVPRSARAPRQARRQEQQQVRVLLIASATRVTRTGGGFARHEAAFSLSARPQPVMTAR